MTLTPPRACALLVAAVLAAYASAFGGVFQFDDHRVIVDNPRVHDWAAWWASMPGIRPLLKASYTLSWTLGGGSPLAFHVFNVACHAASACLVFALARRWTDASPVMPVASTPPREAMIGLPFAVALLVALHPAQTEVVTYISGRSSGLMALFYLASLLCWERGREHDRPRVWQGASLLLFLAALATKETAWTLPFALLLVEAVRNGRQWRAALRAAQAHLAVLALAMVVILALPTYRRMLAGAFALRDPLANLATQVSGVAYLIVNPLLTLKLDIDATPPLFTGWSWLFVAFALAALLYVGLAGARRGLVVGFGVLWFFLHLVPTNSLIARDDLANDRQLTLAMIGVSLAYCSLTWGRLSRRTFAAVIAALAIVLGTVTALRNLDYRSEVALWQASLTVNPRNARAWNNLGVAWRMEGDIAQARLAFQRALELDPSHPQALGNLLELGTPPQAGKPVSGRNR